MALEKRDDKDETLKFMNKLQKAFVFMRVRINLYTVCLLIGRKKKESNEW